MLKILLPLSQPISTAASLEKMFAQELSVNTLSDTKVFDRTGIEKYSYLPTSEQAEILINGRVPPAKINCVYFHDSADTQPYLNALNSKHIPWKTKPELFNTYRKYYNGFKER